jgi:glycosyltransferase involved in cell wall biosynthesis
MCVYNRANYLPEAVESILNQTFIDFEFIILDDGSTDNSLEIIREYAQKDDRIRVVVNDENIGIAKSANKGIALARGEYIARMDSDDISLPDRFDKQIRYLDAHPEVWVLGGQIQRIDEKGNDIFVNPWHLPEKIDLWKALVTLEAVSNPTAMMRRDKIVLVGGYPEEYAVSEDRALWAKLYELGYPIENLPDVVLKYRSHIDNISKTHNKQKNDHKRIRLELLIRELGCELSMAQFQKLMFTPLAELEPADMRENFRIFIDLYDRYVKTRALSWKEKLRIRQSVSKKLLRWTWRYPLQNSAEMIQAILFYPPILISYLRMYWLALFGGSRCRTDD